MIFPQPLVVDDEVEAESDRVDDESAQVRFLAMDEKIADEGAVDGVGAEVDPEDVLRFPLALRAAVRGPRWAPGRPN